MTIPLPDPRGRAIEVDGGAEPLAARPGVVATYAAAGGPEAASIDSGLIDSLVLDAVAR